MNEYYFTTFQDAKTWALQKPGNVFVRSADGNGFTPKIALSKPVAKSVDEFIYDSNPPYSAEIGQLYMFRKVSREIAVSMLSSDRKQKLDEIIRSGDELWEFTNSGEEWDNLAGQSGLSLIRNNKIVYKIIIEMN